MERRLFDEFDPWSKVWVVRRREEWEVVVVRRLGLSRWIHPVLRGVGCWMIHSVFHVWECHPLRVLESHVRPFEWP